jgi:hypothetical protein
MDRSEFHCPVCKSSETVKVSMAYERDSRHSRVHGHAGKIEVGMNATTQTKLGMRLAPPQQGKWSSGTQWALAGLVLFGLAALGSFSEANNPTGERIIKTLNGLIFTVIALVCGWAFYRGKKRTDEWNATEYPRLIKEWNSNWLCEKCGEIFNAT